jgi:hypothetical protein
MPRRVFEQLDIPIDTNIDWTIDGYQGAKEYEDTSQLIGVCHATKVSIGGVAAVIPVFVVKDSSTDLILGRPWSRYLRATFINEDDESYTCIIRSPDGCRIVRFQAAPAVHERNRAYARFPENGTVRADWGKVQMTLFYQVAEFIFGTEFRIWCTVYYYISQLAESTIILV